MIFNNKLPLVLGIIKFRIFSLPKSIQICPLHYSLCVLKHYELHTFLCVTCNQNKGKEKNPETYLIDSLLWMLGLLLVEFAAWLLLARNNVSMTVGIYL